MSVFYNFTFDFHFFNCFVQNESNCYQCLVIIPANQAAPKRLVLNLEFGQKMLSCPQAQ